GINKHNVIAGAWIDASDVAHGFIGPLNGAYTSFDFGGASTGTLPRALDDKGNIVGFAEDPNFSIGEEFLRQANGTIVPIQKDGTPLNGVAQGIITKGETSTGDYLDPNTGNRTGYLATDGLYQSDVSLNLDIYSTNPRSLNHFGTLAGFYVESDKVTTHGFILKNGVLQVVDADNSGTTVLEGINKKEVAAGQVSDASGNPHAFVYDNKTGVFTMINVNDGSSEQQAWGINDRGQVAIATGIGASYIYCPRDVQCPDGGHAVADGRSWKAQRGASLQFDRNGRTGVKAAAHATHGTAQ
ncbi:MAG TPA: hypothetical protein VG274_01430, partial [Rhizomicrobium sp.]|nr:hypothetical protein [Rhizomicrobium sp.]